MNLTGVAMETMRPSGPARLGCIESDMYREVDFICDALRDLVPFLQFKKREKHTWRSATFSKVAGNVTKSNTPPWVLFTFFKLYEWYQMSVSL